ncbi:MAG: glycoside hydrolase [Actinomycetia bacterium]|nr:glycoside hydrolase [Actinomycetes bacterium]
MNHPDKNEAAVSDIVRHVVDLLEVPTSGLTAVSEHGTARRRRARAAVASACAVVLVGAGVLAVQQLSSTNDRATSPGVAPDLAPDSTTTGSGLPVQDAAGVPVTRVDSAFVWNTVLPGSAEAIGSLLFGIGATEGAPYLAWSTAPGFNASYDYVPTLYRSDDGIHWTAAGDSTFTEPDVTRRGLAVQGDTMFAFGTAAATAAIPKGGAGDAVVDISTDQGATWQPQVLPIDLRGLAATDGVQGVGLNGAMAAADGVVVVVAQPSVVWEAQNQGYMIITSQGAYRITYPTCDNAVGCVATTVSYNGATADTASAGATDDTLPIISDLIPLSELGIDPETVEAARTPRVFVSVDGVTFTEATLPPLPDDVMAGDGFAIQATAANGMFYLTIPVSTFDPASASAMYGNSQLVYRSADGMTWEQVGDVNSFASGQSFLGVLPNGTMVAQSYTSTGSSVIATSADGVTWVVHDLTPLIEPSDGEIVAINLWSVMVGAQGITASGAVYNDPIAEAGGRSIERDSVRLEVQSSTFSQPRAYDSESGDEFAQSSLRYMNDGGLDVMADDGSVLASFTPNELQQLQNSQEGQLFTKVLLHSDDGVNWSRENLAELAGSNDANLGFFQQLDDKVLINLIDPSQRTDDLALTMVLVGTRK